MVSPEQWGACNPLSWTMLEDAGVKLIRNDKKRLLVEDEMKELIKGCDVAICGAEPMTAEVMDQAPELRFIARCAVGLDSIDLNAARERNIGVSYVPGANADTVAELTLTHILMLIRGVQKGDALMRQGKWLRVLGRSLEELTVGIIGMGRIGRRTAKLLSAFGANIILCGPKTLIPDEFNNFLKTPAPNQLEDPIKSRGSITISRSFEESIRIADAIIVLRLQKERMMESLLSSIDSYSLDYGLTPEKLSLNNKEIPILHPGPINRDIEISSKVVDEYPNCLINNQVANGIPIRMALLYLLQKYKK